MNNVPSFTRVLIYNMNNAPSFILFSYLTRVVKYGIINVLYPPLFYSPTVLTQVVLSSAAMGGGSFDVLDGPTTEAYRARNWADFGSTVRPYPYCMGTVDCWVPTDDEGRDSASAKYNI